MMLHLGRGTSPDPIEAVKWLTLAADQDDPTARATLRRIHSHLTPAQLEEGRQRARRFVTTLSRQGQIPSP
jgi:TPR repeat protein